MKHVEQSIIRRPLSKTYRSCFFSITLAAISFVVFCSTIFELPQVRDARYCCEQSGIAAAISNVMYHTRLGALYSGVFYYFYEHYDEPLEERLNEAKMPSGGLPAKPPGELYMTTRDGNGVGYPLIATAAFRLFGMHAWALTVTMLLLLALSSATFLLRFSDRIYVGSVILYFTALTVMLFTPLVWIPKWSLQIPVGGIRYFSLLSVLPIFHILLELINPNSARFSARKFPAVLLGVQTAILVVAILVRGSALPLIGAIVLTICVLVWRWRSERILLRGLFSNVVVITVASACTVGALAMSVSPEYLTEQRFGTLIWDRVVESLGLNPAFPFPGVREMFDCKSYNPKGMQPGNTDDNGHCIFADYVSKHHMPISSINDKMYAGVFETAMRNAFFRIAAQNPGEVLETFLYYKPFYIVSTISEDLQFNFSGRQTVPTDATGTKLTPYPWGAIWLLMISLGIPFIYFSATAPEAGQLRRITVVLLLATLFTLPSYLAVWATPPTAADLLLYCLMAFGLMLGAILMGMHEAVSRLLRTGEAKP